LLSAPLKGISGTREGLQVPSKTKPPRLTGRRLKGIRDRLGISQTEMARLVGVHFATVNRWENGLHPASIGSLDIARALERSLANGFSPAQVVHAADKARHFFLMWLFTTAYAKDWTEK